MKKIAILISFLFLLFGCAPLQEYGAPLATGLNGQFSLFFNGPEKALNDITFKIKAVNLVSEDGTIREVISRPVEINSFLIKDRQMLLNELLIPEGRYRRLQIFISDASVKRRQKADLTIETERIEFEINISILRSQNTSLFIHWNSDASLISGYIFRPAFLIKKQVPELSPLLVYVSNEGSDNVYVINRELGQVVGVVMVGNKPKGIAAGTRRDSPRLYVANSGSNSISVIDPTTNKVETEIPLRFGWQPEDIAVYKASHNREIIFSANYGSNTVSVVDGQTYQEIERIIVGSGPYAIAVDPPLEGIRDFGFLSIEDVNVMRNYRQRFFNVYVANKNSKNISVIIMDSLLIKPVKVVNLEVEWGPVDIAVDYARAKAYIANYDSDRLSVLDLVQFARGNEAGAMSSITGVGFGVRAIAVDAAFDRLYLVRERTGDVLIIKSPSDTGQIRSNIASFMGTVLIKGSPMAIAMDSEFRKLFVASRTTDSVYVIDKFTRAQERAVPLSKRPYGIAVFPF